MPTRPTSPEILLAADAALKEHGTITAASLATGIPRATLHDRIKAYRGEIGGPKIPDSAKPAPGFEIYQNSAAYDDKGTLLRQWIGTKREAGDTFKVPAGHVVKGESALVDPDGRVLAKWIKTKEGAGEGLVDGLRAAFAEYKGAAPLIEAPKLCNEDYMTVYPLADLHIGLRAWGKESGENYDVKIAVAQMTSAFTRLVQQSQPSKTAKIVFLGDYIHSNSSKTSTPASGHQLDVDGRWQQVFHSAATLAITMINLAALKHDQVEVCIVEGNHDPDASVCLAVALSFYFHDNARIKIAETAAIAWYCRFGTVLLGATHGHTMPFERMATMLAVDRAEDWGKTKHRVMLTGHIHQEKVKEIATVRVESFASPAAKDAWTAGAGYRSNRALNALTFHKEDGETGRHRVAIS